MMCGAPRFGLSMGGASFCPLIWGFAASHTLADEMLGSMTQAETRNALVWPILPRSLCSQRSKSDLWLTRAPEWTHAEQI